MSGSYKRKDHLYQRAKEEGFRSRASYKLVELNEKFRLFRPGFSVIDLGCFPGGWLQIAQQQVGPSGRVVGVDIREVESVEVEFKEGGNTVRVAPKVVVGDATTPEVQEEIIRHSGGPVDVVLSDMSPQLSGVRFRDVACAAELAETAFRFAEKHLKRGGALVVKTFSGPETDELFRRYSPRFERLSRQRLKSTRKGSTEMYLIGSHFLSPEV